MMQDIASSLSKSAQGQYSKSWSTFTSFCRQVLSIRHLPATSQTISLYVTHLHQKGLKHTSIRTHLSAIAFQHKIHDLPDPTKSFSTQKLLQSYSRIDAPPAVRLPITQPILHTILSAIYNSDYDSYNRRLYTALFSLMYYAALRVSEVTQNANSQHNLSRNHITIIRHHSKQCLRITFTSYKHSSVPPHPLLVHPSTSFCPVKLYSKYVNSRPTASCRAPAFCLRDGRPLTRNHVVSALNTILQLTGNNPLQFNTHSFRIGRATDLATEGKSHTQIALQGRWKSNAFLRYIKPNLVHSRS